jgi:hypothetical protein
MPPVIAAPRRERYPTAKLACGRNVLIGILGEDAIDARKWFERLLGLTLLGTLIKNLVEVKAFFLQGSAWGQSEEGTLDTLRYLIRSGHSVILLISPPVAGHWISVLGYDEDQFYVHDPRPEFPETSDLPVGNTTLSPVQLLMVWDKGPFYSKLLGWPKRLYVAVRTRPATERDLET